MLGVGEHNVEKADLVPGYILIEEAETIKQQQKSKQIHKTVRYVL